MQNALAVYTARRALTGQRLTEIALESGITLRFLAMGGYLPGDPEEIQRKALTTVNGGALLVVGTFATDTALLSAFDSLVARRDQLPMAAMLNDGKLPWCELYTSSFNYDKATKAPNDKSRLDGSVARPQLPALKSAKVRYIIYNQSRRKNCGELMTRLAEAIGTATEGVVADYQRPSR